MESRSSGGGFFMCSALGLWPGAVNECRKLLRMDFMREKVTDPGRSGGDDAFGVAGGLIRRKVVGHKGEIRARNLKS